VARSLLLPGLQGHRHGHLAPAPGTSTDGDDLAARSGVYDYAARLMTSLSHGGGPGSRREPRVRRSPGSRREPGVSRGAGAPRDRAPGVQGGRGPSGPSRGCPVGLGLLGTMPGASRGEEARSGSSRVRIPAYQNVIPEGG
jgi:hypothetical protein